MIPGAFQCHLAGSLPEALYLLEQHGEDSKILAGGQSLIPLMRFRLAQPEHLIDINRVTGLADITESDGWLRHDQLAAIHSPAGLDVHAETPAEIALSILAQIIPIRRAAGHRLLVAVAAPTSTIVTDPICGMEVNLRTAKFTLVVGNETLGFCCPVCLRTYDREHLTPAG